MMIEGIDTSTRIASHAGGARCRTMAALAFAAALAACGGGGGGLGAAPGAAADASARARAQAVTANASGWVTITQPNDVLMQNLAIPADAPARGMWSAVGNWPMIGVNQAVLPDGKVLSWGTTPDGSAQNGRYFDLWDPSRGLADAGSHNLSYDANRQDSFCAPAVYTADGRLMITGGNGTNTNGTTSQYYAPTGGTFAQGPSVADARWYAAMITLADGRPIILGGINPYTEGQWTNPDQAVTQGLSSMTPEVLENGNWRSLFGAQSRVAFGPDFLRASLPKVWAAPDGRVFGIGTDQMYYVDPAAGGGNGAITIVGAYKPAPGAAYTNDTAPNVGPTMSAVMYAPGKVLTVGGNAFHNGIGYPASRKATAIDLNGGGAVMTEQPMMAFPRNFANTIVLPDGKVLVTGGETVATNDAAKGVFAAESWNPATGTWTTLASSAVFRGYHSQTSLLPNGTVLSTGGGQPGPLILKGEVYYPPYLFRSVNGVVQLAPRPQMVGISGLSQAHGAAMQVDMAGNAPISQLVLIGLSVGTHSFNSGQRRVPLAFTQQDIRLTATLPTNLLAPPGYYQLVALDANGVPSRGTIIALGQGVSTPPGPVTPYTPPVIGAFFNAPVIAAGGTATYNVAAVAGVSYSWTFGDGSAATAFSPTASITHVFAAPGVYGVTLTARAADGSTSTRSVLQAVSAAPTARSPNASSAVAIVGGTPAAATNIAPSATLATSYVSAWETLAAVNNNVTPANSADHATGAYGNWRGAAAYGQTDWVSFSWPTPKSLSAFEVYWWNDGQGIGTPTAARVEYWNGAAWVSLGPIGTALNAYNRLNFNVSTTSIRVSMNSALATGILEARVFEAGTASSQLWVANPDADTVAVIDTASNARVAEVAVGASPRSVAVAPDGRVWVTNKGAATISIVNPTTRAVASTVALPRASQPHGLVFAPGGSAFVVLEATGQLLKLDPVTGAVQGSLAVGANPRHVSVTGDGATVLVSRFITNPLPGEGTATVATANTGAEVLAVNAGAMTLNKSIVLRHSDKVDNEVQGSGIPNYLAAAVISPDGKSAWVPSKQDNIKRGTLRNAQALNFQNTVRAISSRIDLPTLAEDYARRVDHDNSSLGSAAAFHPSGAYLFVALETSRQIAVVDAAGGRELAKFDVGRAPQAVSVSADGAKLYVQNFMDRTVSVLDLTPLVTQGLLQLPVLATVGTVGVEKLAAQVLQGKKLFYDARDPRLARDSYMSCASCHSDAGHDGRTWDFTGFGEGLRNTPALKGRAGTGQGFVHWSANFDEIQDFEGQIRNFAGGSGLMSDAQFNAGTRSSPLGDRKAGVSTDLDALAAYLGSLTTFDATPYRNADGTPSAAATAGKAVFASANCAACHSGPGFTFSADASRLRNIGTIKASSGMRLGAALTGLDAPTLRDVWKSAPYLHDGSAPTLAAAVQAHAGTALAAPDLTNLVAYLQQIGAEEPGPVTAGPPASAVNCANEGGTCTPPAGATATVWYGAGSGWFAKVGITGSVACTNAAFGDPIFGTVKKCFYVVTSAANIAPSATLATSFVSAWEALSAVNNNVTPVNSADHSSGAYGNWNGTNGQTHWVSFTWPAARALSAFEVYWWNDGLGIGTPNYALVEYWNGTAWVAVGSPGLALNTYNRLDFAAVTTTSIRVSMKSALATGILEARVFGN